MTRFFTPVISIRCPRSTGRLGLRLLGLAFASATLFPGCQRESVQVYQVPKEAAPKPASAGTAATSGGERTTGGPSERPKWTLPQGWRDLGKARMSLATFAIPGPTGTDSEVAVMPFSGQGNNDLMFLNIWRERLGLKPLDPATINQVREQIPVKEGTAPLYNLAKALDAADKAPEDQILVAVLRRPSATWFIKLQGPTGNLLVQKTAFLDFLKTLEFAPAEGGSDNSDPHAGMAMGGATAGTTAAAPPAAPGSRPTWTLPPGWTEQATPPMLLAKFSTGTGVDVTVSAFPGEAGGLLPNVNRWRLQLKQPAIEDTELAANSSPTEVAGAKATLVEFNGTDAKTGKPARLIGAIASHAGQTWFFKLTGPPEAAAAQKPAFLTFLQTLRLPDAR